MDMPPATVYNRSVSKRYSKKNCDCMLGTLTLTLEGVP